MKILINGFIQTAKCVENWFIQQNIVKFKSSYNLPTRFCGPSLKILVYLMPFKSD